MFARLLAIKIVAGLLLFVGCAGPHKAPRFIQPSTVPIQKSISAAKTHVEQAKVIVRKVETACPQAAAQIDALNVSLDGALSELQTSEGARIQLETQLKTQTDQANALAADYDKASVTITSLKESRHRWVKWFWFSTAGLALCAAWIFRKPIMLAAGFPPL